MTHHHPTPLDTDAVPCRANPERMFPTGIQRTRATQDAAAKAVCRTGNNGKACHVIDRCLRYSLRHAVEGVWAGTTWEERQAIRERTGLIPISITPGTPRSTVYRSVS